VHEFVPGPVEVQVAFGSHPPPFCKQLLTGAQTCPLPEYPTLQEHVFVPGPLLVQVALGSQPPLPVVQESTGEQTLPSPA
jgi:hypothetical protein